MRTALLGGMVGCYTLGILLAVVFGNELRRFLAEVPEICSSPEMERFKRTVAHQMLGALVQMVVLLLPWALYGFGLVNKVLSFRDLPLFVVVPSVLLLAAGQAMKKLERRVQEMPCAQELRPERERVVQTWKKKPLPDW